LLVIGLVVVALCLALSAIYLNLLLRDAQLQERRARHNAALFQAQRDQALKTEAISNRTLAQVGDAIRSRDYVRADRLLKIARSEIADLGTAPQASPASAADRTDQRAPPRTAPTNSPAAVRSNPATARAERGAPSQLVYIQFSPSIAREQVVELNKQLRAAAWRVQGGSGEVLDTANGLHEVRYSAAADRAAAEALARAVSAAGITSRPVSARQVGIIRPGTLEVWISA
jgi:hypothetical protein